MTPHERGTILAHYNAEWETWSFEVVGCRCARPDGSPLKFHGTLRAAEECAQRIRQGSHLRLAAVRPAG